MPSRVAREDTNSGPQRGRSEENGGSPVETSEAAVGVAPTGIAAAAMFEWMISTSLAHWVDESPWAYPFLLTAHGLGMAVVVGLTVMVGVRILGFPSKVPLGAYEGTRGWLFWAFVVNFLSGVVLFIHDAVALSTNLSFQIKVVSLIIGVVVLVRMFSKVVAPAARAEEAAGASGSVPVYTLPKSAKAYAIASMLIWWLSVIVSGRLVAYLAAAT